MSSITFPKGESVDKLFSLIGEDGSKTEFKLHIEKRETVEKVYDLAIIRLGDDKGLPVWLPIIDNCTALGRKKISHLFSSLGFRGSVKLVFIPESANLIRVEEVRTDRVKKYWIDTNTNQWRTSP